jgi:uncharacterized membrane protein (TIGR02234 family)
MVEGAGGSPRRTFGPVVLLGLASAGLAAVASAKPWVGSAGDASDASMTALDAGTRFPLASAVSLVLLAAWGVLLVTRGKVRRAFAAVATLASVGLVAAVVAAYVTLPDSARSSFDELMGRGSQDQGFTGWFWTAAVSAVLTLAPAVLALRLAPSWPEMGSRYDAPGARDLATGDDADPDSAPAPAREQDLWQALDEGRDPTDTTRP